MYVYYIERAQVYYITIKKILITEKRFLCTHSTNNNYITLKKENSNNSGKRLRKLQGMRRFSWPPAKIWPFPFALYSLSFAVFTIIITPLQPQYTYLIITILLL